MYSPRLKDKPVNGLASFRDFCGKLLDQIEELRSDSAFSKRMDEAANHVVMAIEYERAATEERNPFQQKKTYANPEEHQRVITEHYANSSSAAACAERLVNECRREIRARVSSEVAQ